jgi:hypothetical protein
MAKWPGVAAQSARSLDDSHERTAMRRKVPTIMARIKGAWHHLMVASHGSDRLYSLSSFKEGL